MKRILFLLFVIAGLGVQAQRAIDVSYTQDNAGHYFFTATNRGYCPYVLRIDFPVLTNLNPDHPLPYDIELKPGPAKILTLSPIDKTKETQIKYTVQNHKGLMKPVVNPNFTYLLPTAPGVETQAYRIPNTRTNSTHPGFQDSGYAVRLRAKAFDTIYAARRGVVSEVDVHNTENDAGATSTSGWNYIEVYHADGSFAEYGIVKKDGALVKPGQTVEAGMPIGIVGGDQYGRGSEIRFSVSYFPGAANTPIPLIFWTKGNGRGKLTQGAYYTSEFTKALVSAEVVRKPGAKAPARKPKPGN